MDPADHVVLAIHLPQESRVVLAVLAVLLILTILTILVVHVVQVVQVILDIPDLLAGRVVQGDHVVLVSPLVQRDQLPLVVQDNLGLPADLVVLGYLVLLVVHTVPEAPQAPQAPLLTVVNGRSTFPAVLGCSKGQAAIEPPK